MSDIDPFLSYDVGMDLLRKGEPFETTDPQRVSVELMDSWADEIDDRTDEEPVNASVNLEKSLVSLQPTKGALLGLAKAVAVSKDLLVHTPPSLVQPVLNYWLSTAEDERGPQFTTTRDGVATALVKPSAVLPLTPRQVVETITDTVRKQTANSGDPVFVRHVMDTRHVRTAFALMFPEAFSQRGWAGGFYVVMSEAGHVPASVSAVLAHEESGLLIAPAPDLVSKYSTRKHGKGLDSVIEWLDASVGVISAEFPALFNALHDSTTVDIEDDLDVVVEDVFAATTLPMSMKAHVLEAIELGADIEVGYDLVCEFASLQTLPDETPERDERAIRAAGDVLRALGKRCPSCRHLTGTHAH